MSIYDSIPNGPSYPDVEVPDWRLEAMESEEPEEQRKANYSDPDARRARAMEFIEREDSAWDRIVAKAEYLVEQGKYFKFDYEVETLKRAYEELGYTPSEIREMFNNCNSSTSGFLVRELALRVDGLYPDHMRLRRCKASEYYPELRTYEQTAYMGFNEDEIIDLVEFAMDKGIDVRYVTSLLLLPEVKDQIISICSGEVNERIFSVIFDKVLVPNHTDKNFNKTRDKLNKQLFK